ncbi:MAG: UDP-N-acetylmuramoyl-L-alanyl-D-glutamate--2,6-diaminopimelate ligase, partial [Candidatus Omnitrophica bacterium]|nr:UDP-N-acetylmuramoyl-L-alanyl-D-glutamate--2,6-diaminopimelate ligase [Candidatus Omnitrophota bacterium]
KGAKVIVSQRNFRSGPGVRKIFADTEKELPRIAANFYKNPASRLKMIGVTGTNGKTTITYLMESILKRAHFSAGVIGTITHRFGSNLIKAGNTTPGPFELHSILSRMLKEGINHVVMEVSSHSLDQGRVDHVSFDAAVFTNISQEHLDYHKTIEKYFDVKAKIFDKLKPGGVAVLNADDKRVISLKRRLNRKTITYGISEKADVRARNIELTLTGSKFTALTPTGSIEVKSSLIGRHNVSNILAAIALSIAEGISPDILAKGIASLGSVPGRLEFVESRIGFKVFVDFAHTSDALYNILSLLREVADERIITVFGCGGNRDRKKRPIMGKVACKFSDKVIITSDNPRFENPKKIIGEIEKGVNGLYSNYEIVQDRRSAIRAALKTASSGDIVVVAGKGHEGYQIIGDRRLPFDDCKVVQELLKKR